MVDYWPGQLVSQLCTGNKCQALNKPMTSLYMAIKRFALMTTVLKIVKIKLAQIKVVSVFW